MINTTKPLFEYSDVELKAIAYDSTKIIEMHEKNLELIQLELDRRALSNIVTQTSNVNELFTPHQK